MICTKKHPGLPIYSLRIASLHVETKYSEIIKSQKSIGKVKSVHKFS